MAKRVYEINQLLHLRHEYKVHVNLKWLFIQNRGKSKSCKKDNKKVISNLYNIPYIIWPDINQSHYQPFGNTKSKLEVCGTCGTAKVKGNPGTSSINHNEKVNLAITGPYYPIVYLGKEQSSWSKVHIKNENMTTTSSLYKENQTRVTLKEGRRKFVYDPKKPNKSNPYSCTGFFPSALTDKGKELPEESDSNSLSTLNSSCDIQIQLPS